MQKTLRSALALTCFGLLGYAASCSSTVRNSDGSEQSTAMGGAAGSSSASSSSAGAGGASPGSAGSNMTSGSGTTGGANAGGSAGQGGAENSTGGTFMVMNCDASDPGCTCDDTGCFIEDGYACARDSECKSEECWVTEDADNICCAKSCAADQVCIADGSGCEGAAPCEDDNLRCAGDYQRCVGGEWKTEQSCGNLGCVLSLGGCLLAPGESCSDDAQCGEGTCEEAPDGKQVCCTASCGNCKICDAAGTGCADPPSVPEGCDCTGSDASNCADALPCTDDVCNNGVCSNDIQSGFCVIAGQCVAHNQPETGNPCRYCDSTIQKQGWTSSPNTTSCDDGAWCNGTDTCDGLGSCAHQYPSNNRCNGSGPCALGTCDENRDSCYRPDTYQCDSSSDTVCVSNACGSDVYTVTTTTYCSGNSASCSGRAVEGSPQVSQACDNNSACASDSSGAQCEATLGCGNTWCDASTGLCWTLNEPTERPLAEATQYCDSLVLAGRSDWRLPTIHEWLRLAKGCDEATGTAQGASFQSTCTYDPATESGTITPCMNGCPRNGGPSNGCYWPPGMSSCGTTGYWSSTVGAGTYFFAATENWVASLSDFANQEVRCVLQK